MDYTRDNILYIILYSALYIKMGLERKEQERR